MALSGLTSFPLGNYDAQQYYISLSLDVPLLRCMV
jgi:hypothetical protein